MVDIACVVDAHAELGEGTLWNADTGVEKMRTSLFLHLLNLNKSTPDKRFG